MTQITTKPELIAALKDSLQRARGWFEAIPATEFFKRTGEVWSPSDNVDHLIRAVKPIAKAMNLPKVALQAMFGRPAAPSRTYAEICSIYRDSLANGAKASGSYLPNQETPSAPEDKKAELLNQLSTANEKLFAAVEKWDENALDQVQLPHPILGNLTLREMLYFTVHHNLRHASQEGD